jgi:hypothetical protein
MRRKTSLMVHLVSLGQSIIGARLLLLNNLLIMSQRRITVGTTPVLLADYSPKRSSISIILLPTNIEAGNTGNLFIGKGFVPTPTIGAPTQGDILQQAGELADSSKYQGDSSVFKGQYWGVASAANQIAFVDETSDVDNPVTPTA